MKGLDLVKVHLGFYDHLPGVDQLLDRVKSGEFSHNSTLHLNPQMALAAALEDLALTALVRRCRAGEYDERPPEIPAGSGRQRTAH